MRIVATSLEPEQRFVISKEWVHRPLPVAGGSIPALLIGLSRDGLVRVERAYPEQDEFHIVLLDTEMKELLAGGLWKRQGAPESVPVG